MKCKEINGSWINKWRDFKQSRLLIFISNLLCIEFNYNSDTPFVWKDCMWKFACSFLSAIAFQMFWSKLCFLSRKKNTAEIPALEKYLCIWFLNHYAIILLSLWTSIKIYKNECLFMGFHPNSNEICLNLKS